MRADDGPLVVLFGSTHPSSTKKQKTTTKKQTKNKKKTKKKKQTNKKNNNPKTVVKVGPPLTKFSGSAHVYWYSFIRVPLEVQGPVFMTESRFWTWGPPLGKSQVDVGFLKNSDTELHACFNSLYNCNRTCYCNGVVSVTSASRYVTSASRYQSRYSMYIRGLIPRNWLSQFRLEDHTGENHKPNVTSQNVTSKYGQGT